MPGCAAISTGPASYEQELEEPFSAFQELFGIADSGSVQTPLKEYCCLLGLCGNQGKMLRHFPALMRRQGTKLPPEGKGEGSKCKSLSFRVKFGAFFIFFFYLSELWQEASHCCYAFQETHEHCSDKVMGR